MQWSIFHAWFIETESTSVVGLMTGIVAVMFMLEQKPAESMNGDMGGNA